MKNILLIIALLTSITLAAQSILPTEKSDRDTLAQQQQQPLNSQNLLLAYNAQNAARFVRTHYDAANVAALQKQVQAWQQVVAIENRDAGYWLNYYMVSRLYMLQTNAGVLTTENKKRLQQIALQMDTAIEANPTQSFEKSLVKYFEEESPAKASQYLLAAAGINPQGPFLNTELAKHYEYTGHTALRNAALARIPQIDPATALYAFSNAIAAALPDSAIVITNGDYDTYALWYALAGTTKKITVLSLKLLENTEYRQQKLKQAGWPYTAETDKKNLLATLLQGAKNRVVIVSLTVNNQYLAGVSSSLYNTGFGYHYSETAIDNISALYKNLVEKAPIQSFPTGSTEVLKNILPGYITLYRHYKNRDAVKAAQTAKAAEKFAQQAGFWDNYKQYFN